jgi:aryl-alcohol dehydrogenase-like predicted oxidoreductase
VVWPAKLSVEEDPMESIALGSGGPQVSRVGLGLMGMSGIYGPADEAESIATIHAAIDAGITLLDTGDFYGMGHNEMLLRDALRGRDRGSVFIQVKFGGQRDPRGAFIGHDASPVTVTPCSGSAPTTSTCTSRPGSTRGSRSRTRSAPSRR